MVQKKGLAAVEGTFVQLVTYPEQKTHEETYERHFLHDDVKLY
jgi:hypothetical protein